MKGLIRVPYAIVALAGGDGMISSGCLAMSI
jgi:diacylglycerol kinase family enzyme